MQWLKHGFKSTPGTIVTSKAKVLCKYHDPPTLTSRCSLESIAEGVHPAKLTRLVLKGACLDGFSPALPQQARSITRIVSW